MTEGSIPQVPFKYHVELLRRFVTHREDIVDNIEALVNTQRNQSRYMQGSHLSRQFEDCFFARTVVSASQAQLRGQLEEAHWARGFKPRQVQHVYNDLIDPAEMMIRGIHCWQQTRWPGRSGRVHYANTLFNLYVLRCLQFLSMRVFDEEPSGASGRLTEIQNVLNELWRTSPTNQPVIVRDTRWLIPLALSLITDELAPYFEVVQQITAALPEADVLEIQKAHARMLGGHLTSQIRYYCTKDGLPGLFISEHSVIVRTRTSNALDLALLVQDLVGLLTAYDRALGSGDKRMRLDMAGAIYQGISPDPELFLSRVDMLSAYSMIEQVFITTDGEGHVAYSRVGQRHVRLLKEYGALIKRLTEPLRDDFPRFRPVDGGCFPYGVIFGLPSNLIEHMALKAIQYDAETRFSLEDVFEDFRDDGDISAAKLRWVNGWRQLPHIDRDVQRFYGYPQQLAEDIYHRIEQELSRRDSNTANLSTGRLHIVSGDPATVSKTSAIPEVPTQYFLSSDRHIVTAQKAEPYDQVQLLRDRQEGHFLVSYETPDGWVALKKNVLADILGAGRDARLVGLPLGAIQRLRLMCADLVIIDEGASQETNPLLR